MAGIIKTKANLKKDELTWVWHQMAQTEACSLYLELRNKNKTILKPGMKCLIGNSRNFGSSNNIIYWGKHSA